MPKSNAKVLPPAAKLPLAVKKDVRDEFDANLEDFEKQLSDLLETPWAIEINPLEIYPYGKEGSWGARTGSCIKGYLEGAIYRLKYFLDTYETAGIQEINSVCHAHTLTMGYDESGKFTYTGCDVVDGKLRILFAWECLGTNASDSLSPLVDALNDAAPDPASTADGLNPVARLNIANGYAPKVEELQAKFKDMFGEEYKLNPRFGENFKAIAAWKAALKKGASSRLREDWDKRFGDIAREYFEGLEWRLKNKEFGTDDLLQEGFNEEMTARELAIRVVDKLERKTYNESKIENGVLYIQCTPEMFGVNCGDAGSDVLDLL